MRNEGMAIRKTINTHIDDLKFVRTLENPSSTKIMETVMNMKIRENNTGKSYDIFQGDKFAKEKLGASNFLKFKSHKLIAMLIQEKNKDKIKDKLVNDNTKNLKKMKSLKAKISKVDPLKKKIFEIKNDKRKFYVKFFENL